MSDPQETQAVVDQIIESIRAREAELNERLRRHDERVDEIERRLAVE